MSSCLWSRRNARFCQDLTTAPPESTQTAIPVKTKAESIAEACFPLFEPFIGSTLHQAAKSKTELRAVCSGIYEIGPMFGHGGVCFEAVQLPLDDVTVGAGFYVCGLDADSPPMLCVTVEWSRSWACDGQAGFRVAEFAASCHPRDPDRARKWVRHVLPSLERATGIAIERGRPPSRLRHGLQRVLRRVPAPRIMTQPSGSLTQFPDMATFKQMYDKPLQKMQDACDAPEI